MDEINNWILDLRYKGLSNKAIYAIVHDDYPNITRDYVTEYLRSKGLIISSGHGGYRYHSGRGHKYTYEGVMLDSLAEFIFYLYQKSLGKSIIKNYKEFVLDTHKYVPDFIVEGKFYEIKSITSYDLYGWNMDKLDEFPYDLIIVTQQEIITMKNSLNLDDSWYAKYEKC